MPLQLGQCANNCHCQQEHFLFPKLSMRTVLPVLHRMRANTIGICSIALMCICLHDWQCSLNLYASLHVRNACAHGNPNHSTTSFEMSQTLCNEGSSTGIAALLIRCVGLVLALQLPQPSMRSRSVQYGNLWQDLFQVCSRLVCLLHQLLKSPAILQQSSNTSSR